MRRSFSRLLAPAEKRLRQSAEVLPKIPRIGPLHEGEFLSKSAEGYGKTSRGPRASALTCVLPEQPTLGLRPSARVRLLPSR